MLRVLRLFGAVAGQQVRLRLLETLLARHAGRNSPPDLAAAISELVGLGIVGRGRPDGVVVTDQALKLR